MIDGAAIKDIRARLGLTQVQFAKELEVDVATLVRWECNVITPKGPTKLWFQHLREATDA